MQDQGIKSAPPSVLRHRPFFFLLLGRVVSVFAYQMTMVALAWQLYDITNSALALGFVGLAQFLPLIFFTLPVGYVVDSFDRRKVVRACQWGSVCCALVLVAGTLGGWLDSLAVYAVAFALASMRAFEFPGMSAMVPNVVPAEDVPRAMAWFMSAHKTSTIVGPALGGFLYVLGPALVYGLSAFFWLMASMLAMVIVTQRVVPKKEPVSLQSLLVGFRFLFTDRILLGVASLDMFAVLVGGVTSLLPIFARDILETGPWGLGLLRASPAAGALGMSLILARYPLKPPIGPILFGITVIYAVATIGFALSTNLFLSMAALAIVGGSDVVGAVIRMSLVQLRTPDDMRGRVGAANALFIGASNQLGDFESGVVAALVGAVPAVIIGGAGTIAITIVWMLILFPGLYRIHALESDERAVPKPA